MDLKILVFQLLRLMLLYNNNANYYNKHPQNFLNIVIISLVFFCFIRTKLQFLTPCTSSLPAEKPVFELECKYFYIVQNISLQVLVKYQSSKIQTRLASPSPGSATSLASGGGDLSWEALGSTRGLVTATQIDWLALRSFTTRRISILLYP